MGLYLFSPMYTVGDKIELTDYTDLTILKLNLHDKLGFLLITDVVKCEKLCDNCIHYEHHGYRFLGDEQLLNQTGGNYYCGPAIDEKSDIKRPIKINKPKKLILNK
jgi:hypothetical protein